MPRKVKIEEWRYNRIQRTIDELLDKYGTLVWSARSGIGYRVSEDSSSQKLFAIETKDIENLTSENGKWHHGFNSGVLATSRLLGAILDDVIEESDMEQIQSEFPDLDT